MRCNIARNASIALVFVAFGCDRAGSTPTITPGLDYSAARRAFHTRMMPMPNLQFEPPVMMVPGAERVNYQSGGLALSAFVSPAQGAAHDKPAILFLHGGFGFGRDDWQQAQPFRDAGFVVMIPMLRTENGQPGKFTLFLDEVDDVLAAANVLKDRPDVDPKRIFVAGHSIGGTLTMLAALSSSMFKGAAAFSGSADQEKWIPQSHSMPPMPSKEEYVIRSPLSFAGDFKCPTRVYYGSQEMFFRGMSQELAAAAKSKGKDVEAIEVPGDHMSAVPEEMQRAVEFFNGLK